MVEIKDISIDDIVVSEFNTRKDLKAGTEDGGIEELAQSIKEKGLLNPIMVMRRDDGKYELIAGQRRYLACKKLGLGEINAIIREPMDSTDATIISLVENVHRADMNPIDKANAFQKIYEKYQDYEKVRKETGMTVATIKKYLKLINLAPAIKERISTAEGPARIETLSRIADTFEEEEEQEDVLNTIGGFNQKIQVEILKRSDGNVAKVKELTVQAQEGAFDNKICRGIEECGFLDDDEVELVKKYRSYKEKHPEGEIVEFKTLIKDLK